MHLAARSGRFVFVAQWILAVLLPVFFFLGRGFVGAELGWLTVFGIVYGFFVVVVLLAPPVMTLFDRTVRQQKRTRWGYGFSTIVLWVALALAALVVPDAGDGPPLDSALTVWTGGAVSQESAGTIFAVLSVAIGLAYLVAFGFAVAGIVRWRSTGES
ncbi:hypothetical protein ACFM35_13290 [Microbacterium sp. P01]|uniref:hypothetical protein n=1 Tax=Microbacterium sp. P01 TaxID=3366261 RepID=UPI00366F6229